MAAFLEGLALREDHPPTEEQVWVVVVEPIPKRVSIIDPHFNPDIPTLLLKDKVGAFDPDAHPHVDDGVCVEIEELRLELVMCCEHLPRKSCPRKDKRVKEGRAVWFEEVQLAADGGDLDAPHFSVIELIGDLIGDAILCVVCPQKE